jgi:peptidyl-prolyl cis-trans isomerase SurA
MKKFFILFIVALLIPNFAKADVKIIAVVNGESITNTQLDQRVKIISSAANMANDSQTQEKIRKQAIEILINEILQRQEANNLGIQLTDKEFEYALKDLEQKNQIKPGGFKDFVSSKGLNYTATLEQIKAGLIWKKVIARLIQPRVFVTDQEVEAKANSFSEKDVKREAEVYEIIVPVDYGDDKSAKQKADELVKRARKGEDFSGLAKKYSVGKTAKNGGLVGVINESVVVGPIKELLSSTKSGEVSEPKKIQSFYVIIKVNERREFNPKSDATQLKNMVMMEKIEQESKTYVKKLREKAYIERR